MLDPQHDESDMGTVDSGGTSTSADKVQYTVKGIDRRTVEMVREAARHDGMKINSWVSFRLQEAAERSFKNLGDSSSAGSLVDHIAALMLAQQQQSEERLRRIEAELLEITSGQRTIMSRVISKLEL